ncbi:MAG: hypothetical protein DWQ04_35235 [Chloroflexi bacterium]|nr:MAG: hypothetical protein DWQ04_35235 [Chloroflexota bacterium]
MKHITRAMCTELLKLKRTLALWLAIILPFVIAVLQFFVIYKNGVNYIDDGESIWFWIFRQTFSFWTLLGLSLFVTLETTLLSNLEHTNGGWKMLFALPVPRGAVYFAKLVVGLVIVVISTLSLSVFILGAGFLLELLKPGMGFNSAIPWFEVGKIAGIAFVGASLLVALHTWVGMRWGSFVIASGFGIAMTVSGLAVISSDYAIYYPWTLTAVSLNNFSRGLDYANGLLFAGMGALVVALVGGWEFLRRDVL